VRRDGSTPQVKALTIDTSFDAVDYSKCVLTVKIPAPESLILCVRAELAR
jgi:hypothetical protein